VTSSLVIDHSSSNRLTFHIRGKVRA
jgi:hypothetical protein